MTTLLRRALAAAWRPWRAGPGPTALVVAGLALGLALTLLTASFVQDVVWRDGDLPEADRLITFEWRVRDPGGAMTDWFGDEPAVPLYAGLRDTGAPLGPMSRVLYTQLIARADGRADGGADGRADGRAAAGPARPTRLTTALADADLPALFGLRPVAGDLGAALGTPDGIALTVAAAERLFGTAQVLGRTFTVADLPRDNPPFVQLADEGSAPAVSAPVTTWTVRALLPAQNGNGTLVFDALTGFHTPAARAYLARSASWFNGNGRVFARLRAGASVGQLTALAQRLLDAQPLPPGLSADVLNGGKVAELRAMRVLDIGLHGAGSPQRRQQLGSLGVASAGVLGLAVINFINLWSVRTLRRQREIGLRKSLGASPAQLARGFFAEALAVVGVAGALGLLLAWWSVPAAQALIQHDFHAPVVSLGTVLLTAGLGAGIAAFSALPLTLIAQRVRPAESLAGRSYSEGAAGRAARRLMTVLQFGVAAVFSALALTVLWQARHAADLPRGLQVAGRVGIDLPREATPAQVTAFMAEVRRWPGVVAVAASDDVPGRDFGQWFAGFSRPGQPLVQLRTGGAVTPGYLETYGMRLVAGRLSADHRAEQADRGLVLDRRAVQALGFASAEAAIGQPLQAAPDYDGGGPVKVVAVIEDIRLEGPRNAPLPHALTPVAERGGGVIVIHTREPQATARQLTGLAQARFPDVDYPALSLQALLQLKLREDLLLGQLTAVTSLFALGLAAVGIYALAAYTLRRREREIVLRKLHGAGPGAVAGLLVREFAGVLAVACAVALPLAAWLSQRYLADFAERAPVGPASLWVLLATAALLAAVTVLAVARHLHAALALRPLQALRG